MKTEILFKTGKAVVGVIASILAERAFEKTFKKFVINK